jgi:hypothetical protein
MAISRKQFINWLGHKDYAPATYDNNNCYFSKNDKQYYVMEDRTEFHISVWGERWVFRSTYYFKDMQIAYDGTLVIAIQD